MKRGIGIRIIVSAHRRSRTFIDGRQPAPGRV